MPTKSNVRPCNGPRQAVEVLKTYGDWMDHERARLLEHQMDAQALRPSACEVIGDAVGCCALFGLLFAASWVGLGLGWTQ